MIRWIAALCSAPLLAACSSADCSAPPTPGIELRIVGESVLDEAGACAVTARVVVDPESSELDCEGKDDGSCSCVGAWDLAGPLLVEVLRNGTAVASQSVAVGMNACGGAATEHVVIEVSE